MCARAIESVWSRLSDPAADTTEVASELAEASDPEAGPWYVTDFPAPFELRKLQWRLSRAPSGGTIEDVAVMTFHFIKATGGTAGTYTDSTDLPAVETALGTYWNAIKSSKASWMHSDQYRWYKDGPAFYELNGDGTAYVPISGGNPAIRVTEVDVAGGWSSNINPPQVSTSVTEVTSSRKHWGRYYMPADGITPGADGRMDSGAVTAILTPAVAFYNACRAASMVPVVFCIQKPERPKRPSGTLPAAPAVAYEVLSLQVDNLYDIIRSRRWDSATIKTRTALT